MKELMDTKKILICNLSKGIIGEDVSSLLGSLVIASFQSAAPGRALIPQAQRVPFFLYIDEAQSFVTKSVTGILAEARKYKLGLFMAHQYIEQLDDDIRAAIFGNVGTMIVFRVGATDARYIEKEFRPVFEADDFVQLPNFHFYIKLMIDGITSQPFSAVTIPLSDSVRSYKEKVVRQSRNTHKAQLEK